MIASLFLYLFVIFLTMLFNGVAYLSWLHGGAVIVCVQFYYFKPYFLDIAKVVIQNKGN